MHIQPGIEISCNGRLGTMGLILKREEDPNLYLLSCWHVLDGGEGSCDVTLSSDNSNIVARYERSKATANEQIDCAIALIEPSFEGDISNQIVNSDTKIRKAAYWQDGMPVIKTGASTNQTRSKLLYALDNFGNLNPAIKLGKLIDGEEIYCQQSDSGAIWCSVASGNGIAMHSKGGLPDNEAAAVPLKVALQYFKASIYSSL